MVTNDSKQVMNSCPSNISEWLPFPPSSGTTFTVFPGTPFLSETTLCLCWDGICNFLLKFPVQLMFKHRARSSFFEGQSFACKTTGKRKLSQVLRPMLPSIPSRSRTCTTARKVSLPSDLLRSIYPQKNKTRSNHGNKKQTVTSSINLSMS